MWTTYTSGTNLSTTGKSQVEIRTYRTATGTLCTSSIPTVVSWMVNVGPVTTNNNPSQSVVYGGAISTVLVTATDSDSQGSDLSIDAVSYSKNGGSSVNGFPLGLAIFPNDPPGANSRSWNVTGCIKGEGVGTYIVTVRVKDECGVPSSTSFTVIVTTGLVLPVADAFYTGASFYWTTSSSSSTATLTLAATIRNQVANCGDITTARISFFVRNGTSLTPIGGAQNLPVGLVNPGDPSVGAASAIVQYNIGNNTVLPLDIAVRVTGNFYNNTSTLFDKQITIAVPLPGGQIVGGGTLDNVTSGGYLGGNSSKLTDFTFEVKYNKSLSNPQGRVELFIRSWRDRNGNLDNVEHTYKVKSTAISVLAVGQPTPAYAQFGSKSNLSEVLPDGSSIGLESGITLTMDLFDRGGLTTKKDSIGITLYRKNGGIWYSNNWSNAQARTLLKAIFDGEVLVSGSNGSFAPNNIITKNEEPPVKPAEISWNPAPKPFSVIAYPNPSASDFSVILEGGNNGKVQIVIYDVSGKPVKTIIDNSFVKQQIIRFGADLRPGIFMAEVKQGDNRKTIKLVKQ